MKTKDFYFDLPEELIAQRPAKTRGADRLLCLDRKVFSPWFSASTRSHPDADARMCSRAGAAGDTADRGTTGVFDDAGDGGSERRLPGVEDTRFSRLPDLIPENTLMVFNDSKVRKARVFGVSEETGAEAEFLLVSVFPNPGKPAGTLWKVMAKRAKRRKPRQRYVFPGGVRGTIVDSVNAELGGSEFKLIEFDSVVDDVWLDANGHIPLPPYIHRKDGREDALRYQTVYAKETGSMAAPTAGLHFTDEVLARLDAKGVSRTCVTLHVGLGTFLPVRTDDIENHRMHEESFFVSADTARMVTDAKRNKRPVLAVGTTSVRALESAWNEKDGRLSSGRFSTSIFIYPGYSFKVVDFVFTNFHTPESTLLMLVAAFAGKDEILSVYNYAVKKRYRFFSYGDSMLIL